MIKEKKKKSNIIFSEEKEVPILKHYSPSKSSFNPETNFLYSDPPEVILQSKKILIKTL